VSITFAKKYNLFISVPSVITHTYSQFIPYEPFVKLEPLSVIIASIALTVLEKSIKEHPVLTQEQVEGARHFLDSISKKEEIFLKNHNDLIRQFKLLGRIDSERLERLQTELSTAPAHLKKFKEAEIDIERRKIEYDKKILDIRTNLDAFFQSFHQNLVNAIQHLAENSEISLNHINQSKEALGHVRNLVNVMRRLQGELYDLHKAQKELMRGEQRKRGKR
jgi:hypothetical protein